MPAGPTATHPEMESVARLIGPGKEAPLSTAGLPAAGAHDYRYKEEGEVWLVGREDQAPPHRRMQDWRLSVDPGAEATRRLEWTKTTGSAERREVHHLRLGQQGLVGLGRHSALQGTRCPSVTPPILLVPLELRAGFEASGTASGSRPAEGLYQEIECEVAWSLKVEGHDRLVIDSVERRIWKMQRSVSETVRSEGEPPTTFTSETQEWFDPQLGLMASVSGRTRVTDPALHYDVSFELRLAPLSSE